MPVTTTLFDVPLSLDATPEAVLARVDAALAGEATFITFVNPHAWTLRQRVPDYLDLLRGMDLVLADGIGVSKAAGWATGHDVPRMSFDASSLFSPVLGRLQARHGALYVVGAEPGVAERAVARMRAAFPGVAYRGVRDGFAPVDATIEAILAAEPHMVLCGMGAPHQERFLARLRAAGFKGIVFTCGGFLDQLAGAERYYPALIDRLDLRWAWRLVKEPRRLWRRYLIEYRPFLALVLAARLGIAPPPLAPSR